MKSLKNKIFAGALTLASLGFFGEENANAQEQDDFKIMINTFNIGKKDQKIYVLGYNDEKWIVSFECEGYDENHYTIREITWGSSINLHELFEIKYDSGLINYLMSSSNPYKNLVSFENLTKEQIYQDKEFAERTKKIINACESEEKLREMVKKIYKERGVIIIPQIKQ